MWRQYFIMSIDCVPLSRLSHAAYDYDGRPAHCPVPGPSTYSSSLALVGSIFPSSVSYHFSLPSLQQSMKFHLCFYFNLLFQSLTHLNYLSWAFCQLSNAFTLHSPRGTVWSRLSRISILDSPLTLALWVIFSTSIESASEREEERKPV